VHQRNRLILAVLTLAVALHLFMLAGWGLHDTGMAAGPGTVRMSVVPLVGGLAEQAGIRHDLAATCLAVVAGMVVLGAGLSGIQRRPLPPRQRRSLLPVAWSPTPSLIALGISRT
jgi:hypothetical protein